MNMKLIIERILPYDVIHHYQSDLLIHSQTNVLTIKYQNQQKNVKLPLELSKKLFSCCRLMRRLLRTDKSVFLPVFKDGVLSAVVGVYQGKFYKIDWNSLTVKATGRYGQGRNPMHHGICLTDNGNLFVGEYSSHKMRLPVPVWKSGDGGETWQIVYEISADNVRHIHGCFWDPYEKKVWVATGDLDGECHIICADENFEKIQWFGDGRQSWRTCHLIFRPECIYWGMDSPLEPCYLIRMDRSSRKIEKLHRLPGPVWYAKDLGNCFVFSCAAEKGKSVTDDLARLFILTQNNQLDLLGAYKKDIWPEFLFKSGVIAFATGNQTLDDFCFFAEALEGVDGKALFCRVQF